MNTFRIIALFVSLLTSLLLTDCSVQQIANNNRVITDTLQLEGSGKGIMLEIDIAKGVSYNHPTFAIWLEDMDQHYLRTLFVTRFVATGIYGHGPIHEEEWDNKPGPQIRPATLPYWLHRRSSALHVPLMPDSAHPVLDGYTGATPQGSLVIKTGQQETIPSKFRILMEINQSWDWNEYWTNSLYDDANYRTSSQPSLVYAVVIDAGHPEPEYFLNPIGHGHYAGQDGLLYTDLRTMTTALKIVDHVCVKLISNQEE